MKKLVPKHPRTDEFVAQGLYAVNSFKELEVKISVLESKDERGAAFEVFAEAFLVTQEGVDPDHYWPQGKIPLLVQENLGLPRNDFGIDSVYLNQTQQYDACQCKFRTGRPTLGWEELATFVALANSDKFQNKVLFTNCEDVVPILRDRVVLIRGSRLDQLTPDDFRVINDWLSQRPPTPVKKQPRQDQAEALDRINTELQIADRAQSIQFCGTGKSLVSLWLMESRSPDTTLVFVPSLALLSQIRNDWIIDRKKDFLHLCVCSDPRVEDKEGDSFSAADCDFPVSTSADEVRRFLDFPTALPKVVFCTYQSTHVISNAGRHVWDLGIFDEAHKTAGRQGRAFSAALNDSNVPIKKRVFFTATPRHCNPLQKDDQGEAEVLYSMDDEAQYGNVAYELSCRKAVELGIICDYKVLVTVFTTAEVNDWLLKNGRVPIKPVNEGGDFVTAWDVANQLAIAKAYNEYGIKKTFTFHSRVKQAKDFVSDGVQGIRSHLKDDVTCRSVDGSMNMGERRKIMEVIKDSRRGLLANAKCLTEGVNLPSVDCVAFLSPKRSRIDVAQAMGRGMRKNSGSKKLGYVIVPLYVALAEGESYEEATERAKFDTVLEVLQTLKEIDESFTDYLKELPRPKTRAQGSSGWRLSEHIEFIAPTLLLEDLANTIGLESIDGLIPSLEQRLAELEAFKEANGHCNVPVHGSSLGLWLSNQRALYSRGKLAQDLIDRLNALGVSWDVYADLLEQRFAELVAFKETNAHCNPPADSGLGQWCQNQRDKYAKGSLDQQLFNRLDALGFCWNFKQAAFRKFIADLTEFQTINGHCNPSPKTPLGRRCVKIRSAKKLGKGLGLTDENIAELLALGFSFDDPRKERRKQLIADLTQFKAKHGHCDLPLGSPLSKRAQVIRQYYKQGFLTDDEIAQLNALDFCWNLHDVTRRTLHEKLIADLTAFKAEHGDCNVPERSDSDKYKSLAARCTSIRAAYRNRTLTDQEIAEINALGFCWDHLRIRKLKKTVADLAQFKAEHGHCNVPARNDSLGQRCRTLREIKEDLPPDIIAELNVLGFCWDSPRDVRRKLKQSARDVRRKLKQSATELAAAALWDKTYAELVAYSEIHGHCNVPASNGPLGVRCTTLRCRKARLSPEHITKLDALGFCWDPIAALWDNAYAALVAYREFHGDCNVPQSSGSLGSWCNTVRSNRKRGTLSTEQIARLDAISFCWGPLGAEWDKNYAELVTYKEAHGHLRVSRKGSTLGNWCGTQRMRYKQGKLSLERIAKLEAIGFPWDAREEFWDKNYADLVAYKRIHGHCNVPTESGSLGSWCNSQRQRRNSLSTEQIAKLDIVNFCWGITAAAWDKNYAELVAYKEAHGHCNVPKENGSLGRWCHNQRHRRSQSTPERIAQLDALGFCWQFRSRTVPKLNMAFPAVDLVNPRRRLG